MKANEYFGDLKIMSVYDRVFEGGQIYPTLATPEFHALEMIAEGETDLICDGQRKVLKAPVIFWIRHSCKRYRYFSRVSHYHHLWIDYSGARGDRINDFLCKQYPDDIIPLSVEKGAAVLSLFQELKEKFSSSGGYDPNEMTVNFEQLICRITTATGNEHYAKGDPYRIYQAWEMIRHNPFHHYRTSEMASERGISEVYFRMLFQRRFNIPFQRFLQQSRLDYAATLLLSAQKYRINELADKCGFSNVSGFSNAFYRRFGMFPREYQQSGGGEKK